VSHADQRTIPEGDGAHRDAQIQARAVAQWLEDWTTCERSAAGDCNRVVGGRFEQQAAEEEAEVIQFEEEAMGANIWFWLIYVIFGIFGLLGIGPWYRDRVGPWGPFGGWMVLFILIGLLGLHVFGSPVR